MRNTNKIAALFLLTVGAGYSQLAFATPAPTVPPACDRADVQITSYQKQDGSSAVTVPPISATACYGAFNGNDDVSMLGNNLGYDNVGWLNKESEYWPGLPGAFVTEGDLQNLQGAGNIDPGWIFFGKYEDDTDDNVDNAKFLPASSSKAGFGTYTYASDLISLSNCKNKDGNSTDCKGDDVVKGEWTYKPPVTNPQQLLDMLGTDKYFDQITVVFKSAHMFALYNFNIKALGLDPVVGTTDENYMFRGVWDMSNTLLTPNGKGPGGLSHISIWGRDPVTGNPPPPPTDVPAPFSIALTGLGLLLLGLQRRRRQA